MQVLSAEVITSLPNANVADALGRLPSVTLERDEGEGKYVQIRGTEPRLSNLTIDGVNVPSPESGVRQIKLDTIASDLVESIEINKTLQANMDGDGIGGSVNLRTKTAGEQPMVMISALGGYTPIIGGRGVSQVERTLGKRFGRDKQLGVLIGGTYDWNGRGINDIEPSPTVDEPDARTTTASTCATTCTTARGGASSGSTDYRREQRIEPRGARAVLDVPELGPEVGVHAQRRRRAGASIDWRRPDYAVGNLVGSGRHTLGQSWLTWDASVARSRMLQSGGNGGAKLQVERTGHQLRVRSDGDDRPLSAAVQRVVFHARARRTPRTSRTTSSRTGIRRQSASRRSCNLQGAASLRADRITSDDDSARSRSAARSGTATSTTTPTPRPTPSRRA